MRADRAIEELTKLMVEAKEKNYFVRYPGFDGWRAKVRGIFVAALGKSNNLIERCDAIQYGVSVAWSGMPESAWDEAKRGGVIEALS